MGTANEINYKLQKHQKIEGTFSGDINQKQSVQLIIVKNTVSKLFEIIPFYFDKDNNSTQFDLITFEKSPSIISYHFNNNNLTLLATQKIKNKTQLVILDLDLTTKKHTSKIIDDFKDAKAIFRLENKTIFVHKTVSSLKITEVINSVNQKKNKIIIDSQNFQQFRSLFEEIPDIVNTNEYVKNGSTNKFQGYYYENNLIFTKINKKNTEVNSITTDLNNYSFKLNRISLNDLEGVKDLNTFLYNNKLYTMLVSKNNAHLKIIDINNSEEKFSKSLNTELKNHFNNDDLENFIKQASKKRNKPTITVNETIENKLVLNIDYVDTTVYNYNYNWWFHHWMWQQQQWHMQQSMQQIKVNIPSFGPNTIGFENVLSDTEKTNKSIKLVLDTSFKINKEATTQTIKKEIDKEKYLDDLKENKSLKHITASFQENSIRYIYYSKKLKTFIIKTSNL
tara:strand:- start:25508 stop:26860 length:1353 start_codon:yes stop_codon:yes gene_type:complete